MATFETNGVTVEFNSNVDGVLEALENAKERALAAIGETAVDYARDEVPVDTGLLKDSLTYSVDGDDVYIGTNLEYGKYVEFGTGIYSEEGGRQTPWVYKDKNGEWHYTEGAKAQPFLRPAAENHGEEYKQLLIDSLQNV